MKQQITDLSQQISVDDCDRDKFKRHMAKQEYQAYRRYGLRPTQESGRVSGFKSTQAEDVCR